MKFTLLLLVALAAVCCGDVVHEEGRGGGELLYRGCSGAQSSWQWSQQKKKVRYPKDGEYEADIGFLKIDNEMNSDYSTHSVKSGGVGHRYVELEFYAPAMRGYKYNVEIRKHKPKQ